MRIVLSKNAMKRRFEASGDKTDKHVATLALASSELGGNITVLGLLQKIGLSHDEAQDYHALVCVPPSELGTSEVQSLFGYRQRVSVLLQKFGHEK